MARARSPNRDKAKEIYLNSNGSVKLKDIAKELVVKDSQIRKWKSQDKWDDELKGALPKTKSNVTNKKGAPKGNKNAVGNSGGGAPKGNKNAQTHGFFSKYLPEETLEIMQEIETRSPIDMLWDNIMIQYTAIIRAQRIMYVRDKKDITKSLRKSKGVEVDGKIMNTEEEWEFQYAWDKQANFLQAQSRAMAQLTNMIKKYEEMCKSDLATEEQKLRIDKLKVDIKAAEDKIEKDNNTDKPIEIKIVGFDEDE